MSTWMERPKPPRTEAWTCAAVIGCCLSLLGCMWREGDAGAEPAERKPRAVNRLSHETSPYLLRQAHGPVDWYPWSPEALDRARTDDKLIFLSIGFSSCHWCQVMERQVFSDPEIARYMNEHFINIKIDREEHPELDEIYMTALTLYLQAIGSTQSGGWPLSLFLTPDGKPLGGGTYFPPRDQDGRIGFPKLMRRIVETWQNKRLEMQGNANFLAAAVQAAARPRTATQAAALEMAPVTRLVASLGDSFDPEFGGFGYSPDDPERPKFPLAGRLSLLQYAARHLEDEDAGRMLYRTLDKMAAGGIYDHVGGGFHRYSTDRYWRVPHFEKMLCDNAQLVVIYLDAYAATHVPRYREAAEETLRFLLRDLMSPDGAFQSSLDADTDGQEGRHYIWTRDELATVLTNEEMRLAELAFGWRGDPTFPPGYVLEIARPIPDLARDLKLSPRELDHRLAQLRVRLFSARQRRPAPARDEKVIAGWNGLMLTALAHAAVVLDRPEFLQTAQKSATYLLTALRDERGRLRHCCTSRPSRIPAYVDDYAFLIEGLLELHQATRESKWLNAARRLQDLQLELFWDEQRKACFYTTAEHEPLLVRPKLAYDTLVPSGNSVTVRNLIRLAALTRLPTYRDRARETLEVFAPQLEHSPGSLATLALALAEYLDENEATSPARAPESFASASPEDVTRAATGRTLSSERLPARGHIDLVQNAPRSELGTRQPEDEDAGVQPAGGLENPLNKKKEVVSAEAFLSVDRLPAGQRCKLLVRLSIQDPWHINANPAQPDYLVPTEITVKSKLGTRVLKWTYPPGEKLTGIESDEPHMVYAEQVDIFGLLAVPEQAGGGTEELTFEIKFQPCNADNCLQPRTIKLKLPPVTVAGIGEPVGAKHPKLFSPARK